MFEKRKDSPPGGVIPGQNNEYRSELPSSEAFNARSAAVIGSTIKIKGDVTGKENLVIEGKVEGSVELAGHDLTIGAAGQVIADLTAKTVKVEGQITGDITGTEKVIITKSGRVLGNIVAPRVTLEDGAKFKGSIDMDPGVDSPEIAVAPKRSASTPKPVADDKQAQSSA
jgi:cytoskeletal protein CcmA (bactofilin family)